MCKPFVTRKVLVLKPAPVSLLKMIIWSRSRNCPYVVFLQWNNNNDLPLNGSLVFLLLWLQEKRYLNRTPDLKEKKNWREEIVCNHDVKLRIWRNREREMKYEKLSTFLTLFTRAGILKSVYLKIYKPDKNLYTIALLLSLPVLYEKPQDHH